MFEYLERITALFIFIAISPLFLLLLLLIFIVDGTPTVFKQKRAGKNKKPFYMFKFRTMVKDAEKLKSKYRHLNEADGPAFKIYDDPRYTKLGRIISHSGMDEIPQLINVIKGEMVFIGPRPLPVREANKVPAKYKIRFSVKPGLSSSWVIEGTHRLTFKEWMQRDIKDVKNKSFFYDFSIVLKTLVVMFKLVLQQVEKILGF